MKKAAIDLVSVRLDTPGCEKVLHFNNAGASLPTTQVLSGVVHYLQAEADMGGYEAEEAFAEQIKQVHHSVAKLINARPSEIALVESATKAWNLALSSIEFTPGDRILTSSGEYLSNYLALLQVAQKHNLKIEMIPNDQYGQICLSSLSKMVDEKVKLIAITHIPSTNGVVNPLQGISEIAKSVNALFLLDACQSVGQMPIDVVDIGCDFLAATGRKFLRAPRGTGFLYIKEETLKKLKLSPPFSDLVGGLTDFKGSYSLIDSAKRFEIYENNFANRLGLGLAVEYALNLGMDNIWEQISKRALELRSALKNIQGVELCDTGIMKSGIVTFKIVGFSSLEIKKYLKAKKINVSIAFKESALDLHERKIDSIIRASVNYYNSNEEINFFCKAIRDLLISKY